MHFDVLGETPGMGHKREDLTGRSYKDLLAPGARVAWNKHAGVNGNVVNQALALGEEMETLWKTRDGAILEISPAILGLTAVTAFQESPSRLACS